MKKSDERSGPVPGTSVTMTPEEIDDLIQRAAVMSAGYLESLADGPHHTARFSDDGSKIIVAYEGDEFEEINFAKLCPVPSAPHDDEYCDCEGCEAADALLTPRNANVILYAAETLRINMEGDPESVLEELPPLAQLQGVEIVGKLMKELERIVETISAGNEPTPNCTGEEMVLHMLLDGAADQWRAKGMYGVCGPLEAVNDLLPECRRDADFGMMGEMWFEDADVLWLFDPAMDGIEDSPEGQFLGVAYLHPKDWFKPFRTGATTESDTESGTDVDTEESDD